MDATFLQGLRLNKWIEIPGFVQNDGSQEEVSQKPPDYEAFAHVQMQIHL